MMNRQKSFDVFLNSCLKRFDNFVLGISFPELAPQSFSFNSPLGMCKACNGLGTRLEMDPTRVMRASPF